MGREVKVVRRFYLLINGTKWPTDVDSDGNVLSPLIILKKGDKIVVEEHLEITR